MFIVGSYEAFCSCVMKSSRMQNEELLFMEVKIVWFFLQTKQEDKIRTKYYSRIAHP